MRTAQLTEPHGGNLINLMVNDERRVLLKNLSVNLPDILLNGRQLCDFELLATGAFSPLEGFLTRDDYESVLDRMRLQDDTIWPVPVCLDISSTLAGSLETGSSVAIRDQEGFLLAIMHVDDIWLIEPEREARTVYGTTDLTHPGVNYLLNKAGDYYIGGKLEVISLPIHSDFKQYRLSPEEVRSMYRKLGWRRVVGFQTRNPIHRAQFELTVRAMQRAKANLLILPMVDTTVVGNFDHYTRVRCYREMFKHYPPDSFILNLLPLAVRMAGPRNAVLHMIIAKNYGCTHFIVGRKHSSPETSDGNVIYGENEIKDLASRYSSDIGIEVIPFDEMVYIPAEDEYGFLDHVPENTETISLSGTDMRDRIRTGKRIPQWATFPEVVTELRKAYPPPESQGVTIFLTGLSGAGKSTIARILYSRFLEMGGRPATLLDGDIVRHNLSSELTFSKEHRDINVRRIGFVASEITKNRGIAICAPIAPYSETRNEIRSTIENYGGFIEVHVATPIEECEKRDRKGMYAKARAGLIKGFTGVDDPYEEPVSPEVCVDTTDLTPDEAVQEILLVLGQKGYI